MSAVPVFNYYPSLNYITIMILARNEEFILCGRYPVIFLEGLAEGVDGLVPELFRNIRNGQGTALQHFTGRRHPPAVVISL